ncbi:hypothetical protein CEXT_634901 [Caerostris extrusa]|uniref:Uncharacterized protein n=1 Tax=Caerostris extrusa TaxID=172846 RepID=A0AAV4WIR0_CAEEX|nr:hypothetical protein CEXT_634901 [Caerostris extrusa]
MVIKEEILRKVMKDRRGRHASGELQRSTGQDMLNGDKINELNAWLPLRLSLEILYRQSPTRSIGVPALMCVPVVIYGEGWN